VNAPYSPAEWTGFGTAMATAAAALAGLLFIAVSINLKPILAGKSLPNRAALTLILFAMPLVASMLVIVPGQATDAVATELLVIGIVIAGWQYYLYVSTEKTEDDTVSRRITGRILPGVTSSGFLILAGATLLAGTGGGLYWLVASFLSSIAFGLLNTWVLLVEILR
jgi:hypothetical protein